MNELLAHKTTWMDYAEWKRLNLQGHTLCHSNQITLLKWQKHADGKDTNNQESSMVEGRRVAGTTKK